MSKKRKKRFISSKHSSQHGSKHETTILTSSPIPSSMPIIAPDRPVSNIVSFHWVEIRLIAIIFSLLILALIVLTTADQQTHFLDTVSSRLSKLLHIEE